VPQNQQAMLISMLIGGLIAGGICGAIAYAVAAWKKRQALGIVAFIICTLCGPILGLLLAGPVAVIFIVVTLIAGEPESKTTRMFRDDDYGDYDTRLARRREATEDDHRQHWQEARRENTTNAGSDLMQQAASAYRAGRHEEALGLFQRVVDDPGYAKDHEFARNCLGTLRKKRAAKEGEA